MSIRDRLKQREEKRNQAANGNGLPDGVTRYVRMGGNGEVNEQGKTFVLLRDPLLWYFYFVHEAGDYATRSTYIKKHTCLNSPRKAPETDEEAVALFDQFEKPNPDVCISDRAKAKRVLYFMIPVYDPEYKTWRVIDTKEFHASNIMDDIDKLEKSARKFNKSYTLVGDAFHIKKADKTFSVESGELDEEVIAEAQAFLTEEINYEELANFREESDIIEILRESHDDYVDKSVLPGDDVSEEDPAKAF